MLFAVSSLLWRRRGSSIFWLELVEVVVWPKGGHVMGKRPWGQPTPLLKEDKHSRSMACRGPCVLLDIAFVVLVI
jgi:hypothetical protein